MIVSTRLVQMCEIIFHGGVGDAGICSSESTGAIERRGLHHLDPTASALARAPHQHLREASAVPARLSPGIAGSRWACGPTETAWDAGERHGSRTSSRSPVVHRLRATRRHDTTGDACPPETSTHKSRQSGTVCIGPQNRGGGRRQNENRGGL